MNDSNLNSELERERDRAVEQDCNPSEDDGEWDLEMAEIEYDRDR